MFRKKEPSDYAIYFLVIGIIVLLSSTFVPFLVITIGQDIFYRPEDSFWLFQAPITSYIIVGVAVALIGAIFCITAYILSKMESRKENWKTWGMMSITIPSLIAIGMAVNQYYYFNDQGIHQSSLTGTNEELYAWSDMQGVSFISEVTGYVKKLSYMEVKLKNGKTIEYPFNDELRMYRGRIQTALEQVGVEVQHVEKQVEEDN